MNQFPSGVPFGDSGDPLILFNPATGWMAWKPPAGQAPSIPNVFPQMQNFQFPNYHQNMSVLEGSTPSFAPSNSFMATPTVRKRKESPSESYSSEAAHPAKVIKQESNWDDDIQNIDSSSSEATPPSHRNKSRRQTLPPRNHNPQATPVQSSMSTGNQPIPSSARKSATGVLCTLCADLGSDRHFQPSSVESTNHAAAHARQTKKSVKEAIVMCFPTSEPPSVPQSATKVPKPVTPPRLPVLRQVPGTQTPLRNKQAPAIIRKGSQTTRKIGNWNKSEAEIPSPQEARRPPAPEPQDSAPLTEVEFLKGIVSEVGREFYLKNRKKHGEASQLDNELRIFTQEVENNPTHPRLGQCNVPRCNYRCRKLTTTMKTHRSLSSHILSHFPDPLFHCTLCDDFFRQGPSHHYSRHSGQPISQHSKDRRWTREKELIDLFRRCFTSLDDLNKSGSNPAPKEPVQEWGYVDLMKQTLSPEFVKKLQGIRNRYATAPKTLCCAVKGCNSSFGAGSSIYNLFGHISKHHNNPLFQCLDCQILNKFPLAHTKNYHRGRRPRYRMIAEDDALEVLNQCFPGPNTGSEGTSLSAPGGKDKLVRQVVSNELWELLAKCKDSYTRENFKCSIKGCTFSGSGNYSISAILTHVAGAHQTKCIFKCLTCDITVKNIQYHVSTTHKNQTKDIEIIIMDEDTAKTVLKKCFPGPHHKKGSSGSNPVGGRSLMHSILSQELVASLAAIKDLYPTNGFKCGIQDCAYGGSKNRCLENMLCHAGTHVKYALFYCRTCQTEVRNFYSHSKVVVHAKEGTPLDIYLLSEDRLLSLFKQCYPGPKQPEANPGSGDLGSQVNSGEKPDVKKEAIDLNAQQQQQNPTGQAIQTSGTAQFVMDPIKELAGDQVTSTMTIIPDAPLTMPYERLGVFKSALDPEFRNRLLDIKSHYNSDNFFCAAPGCGYGGKANFKLENMVTHVSGKHMQTPVFHCQTCRVDIGGITSHFKSVHQNSPLESKVRPISDKQFYEVLKDCFPGPNRENQICWAENYSADPIFISPTRPSVEDRRAQEVSSAQDTSDQVVKEQRNEVGEDDSVDEEEAEEETSELRREDPSEENQSILRGSEEQQDNASTDEQAHSSP